MNKLIVFLLLMVSINAQAKDYSDEQIVNAIFKAEGGYKAKYLYGIRSVNYRDEAEARKICFNTVRNNRVRFTKQSKYQDFIEFLGSRYCPTENVSTEAEKKVNKYWLKNVRFFLQKT
jgi:hypothetical protein